MADTDGSAWRGDADASKAGAGASIVRPYALTRGRVSPTMDLPVEATLEVLAPELAGDDIGRAIIALCAAQAPSVAEVSAGLRQPLGVTRVLLSDLVGAGAISVRATLTDRASDLERHDLIERTIRGLRAL